MRLLFLLLIFSQGLFQSCQKNESKDSPPIKILVNIVDVKKQNVPAILEAVGTIQSSHMVDIRARVEGYLDRIAYIEGDNVKMGDLLFQIDPRPFQAKLDSALAELAAHKAILWDAIKIRNRLEPLFKQNAISERDLDNSISKELAAQAQVEASEANVRSAQLNLGYTSIRAPIDGITSAANYREGSLITSMLEKPLTTVSATNPIWVNFSISENSILYHEKNVKAGRVKDPADMKFVVEVILADGSLYPYKGVVDFLEPYYNQYTGTLNVRTTFENPNDVLKPYQFVQVKLLGAQYVDAFIVPKRAVLQGVHGPFVYIIDKDEKAEIALVELGSWWNEYWIIQSGLKEGDKVIVDGTNKVQRGSSLQVDQVLNDQVEALNLKGSDS
jgi:membrane fusion protein (multidrug efflux system)